MAQVFWGVYFEGHFVTIVPGDGDEDAVRSRPVTTMSRPARKRSGTEPL